MAKMPGVLVGCAGEHYVAYRLSAMGYLVALTRGGSPAVDLMVGSADGRKTVAIQVKTSQQAWKPATKARKNPYWYWRINANARKLRGKSVFYAFVNLKGGKGESQERPDVFIVPSDVLAKMFERRQGARTNSSGCSRVNVYPNKAPTSFFFDLMEKDGERWREAWHLVAGRLS